MFKIIRFFIGTALGLWIASYFLPRFDVSLNMAFLWATLIIMAVLFVVRGFKL